MSSEVTAERTITALKLSDEENQEGLENPGFDTIDRYMRKNLAKREIEV